MIIQPLHVVAAVILIRNKIVLTRRAETLNIMPGLYEFPGGKVEKGETEREALKRGLSEELSINIKVEDMKTFSGNVLHDIIEHKNRNSVPLKLTLFIIDTCQETIYLNPYIHSDIIKVNLEELCQINNILETDKKLIPSLYNHLKSIKL